jgi:aspartate/methionine/tyrosine aminotransferase
MPTISNRLTNTDLPAVGAVCSIAASEKEPVNSLAVGIVHWPPPQEALLQVCEQAIVPSYRKTATSKILHNYTPDFGLDDFRQVLRHKLETQNHFTPDTFDVVVTSGANQGIASIVSSLCDAGDRAIIFSPYYFNHMMALQMNDVEAVIVPCHEKNHYLPTVSDLIHALESHQRIKMVIICNPCNPTGAIYPQELIDNISRVCQERDVWLVSDETYEYFVYGSMNHYTPRGDHILNVFSFSKAFGMSGWRVGYIVYPKSRHDLEMHFAKYQDTVPCCCPSVSQLLAKKCLEIDGDDRQWSKKNIETLKKNRELILNAIEGASQDTEFLGAIYIWSRFPNFKNMSPEQVSVLEEWKTIEWLVKKHRIAVSPGSCFGEAGSFRICFAPLTQEECVKAAAALKKGLDELASGEADIDMYATGIMPSSI